MINPEEERAIARSALFEKIMDTPEYQEFESLLYDRLYSDLISLSSVFTGDEALRLAGSIGTRLEVIRLAAGEAATGPRLAEEARARYEQAAAREVESFRRAAERRGRTTTASVPTT